MPTQTDAVALQAQDLRKLPVVCRQTGQSAATIYRRIKGGTFPAPVKTGVRASAWVGTEVDKWIADRIADRDAA